MALLSMAALVRAEPFEFSGYLTLGDQTRFILKDLETGKVAWLVKGQSFQSLTLTEFDPKSDSLTLRGPTGVVRLHLKEAKVQDREAELSAALAEEERRLAKGERNESQLFLTRIALYTVRRDLAGPTEEKIRQQQAIIATFEERQAWIEAQRKTGLATNFDVLAKSEDLLRAKALLAELKTTGKLPSELPR